MDRFKAAVVSSVFAFAFFGIGCASTGEKTLDSFSRTRANVSESRAQVGDTLTALRIMRMARGDGLKEAYQHYKKSVDKLEKSEVEAKQRALALKEQADTHIQEWEAEMKSVKDAQIKASLESRRQAVRSNFKLVQMYADDVSKAYGPFISGNKDIVQALSIDLSAAGISNLGPSMERVMDDGTALDQKLWSMQQSLDNIANGISPLGNMQ